MTTTAEKTLEVKAGQRERAKRATLEALKGKKRAEREFSIVLDDSGPMTLLFRAVGATEYDKLLTRHPPRKEQLVEGAAFDIDSFGPALLSKVCVEPALEQSEWSEIWNSPDWNRGEVLELFGSAVELCNRGLDLTPTVAG